MAMVGAPILSVSGLRGATIYHVNDGYYYHVSSSDESRAYLKCVQRRECGGRAVMPLRVDLRLVDNFRITIEHNHDHDLLYLEVIELRRRILIRCRNEAGDFRRIYDEECARVPENVASQIAFQTMVSSMRREREALVDAIPQSIEMYGEMLSNNPRFNQTISGEEFFRGTLVDDAGRASVVFISPYLSRQLRDCSTIMMDGTFKTVPSTPQCTQLFTVMAICFDHAFPILSALMERKTKASYDLILAFLKNAVPDLNPTAIISDFEAAIQRSAAEAFPASQVVGCWFHSANAIMRKVKRLGHTQLIRDNPEAKRITKMAMALPLLPADKIEEGFEFLVNYARDSNLLAEFQTFVNYLNRVWIQGVGAQSFSVFGQRRRTNNDMEAYHRNIFRKMMQPHPNVWLFTDGLRKLEHSYVLTHQSLARGENVIRLPRNSYILSDERIVRASHHLVNGTYSTGEFLRVCSYSLNNIMQDVHVNSSDSEDEGGLVGLPPVARLPLDDEPIAVAVRRQRGRGRALRPAGVVADHGHHPFRRERGRGRRRMIANVPEQIPEIAALRPQAEAPLVVPPLPEALGPQAAAVNHEEGARNCVVCLTNPATHVVIPCGHVCLCLDCSRTLPDFQDVLRCPTCREPSTGTYLVYLNV